MAKNVGNWSKFLPYTLHNLSCIRFKSKLPCLRHHNFYCWFLFSMFICIGSLCDIFSLFLPNFFTILNAQVFFCIVIVTINCKARAIARAIAKQYLQNVSKRKEWKFISFAFLNLLCTSLYCCNCFKAFLCTPAVNGSACKIRFHQERERSEVTKKTVLIKGLKKFDWL